MSSASAGARRCHARPPRHLLSAMASSRSAARTRSEPSCTSGDNVARKPCAPRAVLVGAAACDRRHRRRQTSAAEAQPIRRAVSGRCLAKQPWRGPSCSGASSHHVANQAQLGEGEGTRISLASGWRLWRRQRKARAGVGSEVAGKLVKHGALAKLDRVARGGRGS
eukprot:3345021-Pleurochrysis_carterae.AAC.3